MVDSSVCVWLLWRVYWDCVRNTNTLAVRVFSTIMSYVLIEIDEKEGGGLCVVHCKKEVFFPPHKNIMLYNKSVKRGEEVNEKTWTLYKIQRCFYTSDDFNKINAKLKQAEDTSNIETDLESTGKIQRKRKVPKKFDPEDPEIINESDDSLDLGTLLKVHNKKKKTQINISSSELEEEETLLPKPPEIDLNLISNIIENSQTQRNLINIDLHKNIQKNRPANVTTETGIDSDFKRSNNFPEININRDVPKTTVASTNFADHSDCNKHFLSILVQIKHQNCEILNLLREKKVIGNKSLPKDVPVSLPLETEEDLNVLENYLNDENISVMISYYATLGGNSITNKTNIVLKNLITNQLAVKYSFLGSRNEKKAFSSLKLKEIIKGAVLLTCANATENDINDCIKVWLKHAKKRLMAKKYSKN